MLNEKREQSSWPRIGWTSSRRPLQVKRRVWKDFSFFVVFDRDGDGLLTLEELRQTIHTLGKVWSLSDIKKKLPKYANSVDFPEFLALMADDLMDEEESESETIRGMFDFYDSENKGFIYWVRQNFPWLFKSKLSWPC